MLLSIWHDLSDVKLAEALDDRASFRRYCGFSVSEPTPEPPPLFVSARPFSHRDSIGPVQADNRPPQGADDPRQDRHAG
ncbi:transposase [Ensifer sp. ENS07]|uniref:transposase n=1 Tax=Ensifer sp. ENS07 TaxID=2769274 RepID=UPI00177BCED8|nr:transposase [Ensifer sp. ENS07]